MNGAKPILVVRDEEQAWNRRALAQPVMWPHLRQWAYNNPAVVLGASQRDRPTGESSVPVLGRQSGGGAVLVGPWMLSASIVLPTTHPLAQAGPIAAYCAIGEAYAAVLRSHGGDVESLSPARVTALSRTRGDAELAWACFGGLAPGEVVVDGRKLLGLAQVCRRNGVLLVAGLVLYRPDWSLLCRALDRPFDDIAALERQTTSCAEICNALPTLGAIAGQIYAQLRDVVAASPPKAIAQRGTIPALPA